MAKLFWFDVHACSRLDEGEFDLPSLPFRFNPSGAVPRKLEAWRWRGIQDFGGPRRVLLLLPLLANLGAELAHAYAFGRKLGARLHTRWHGSSTVRGASTVASHCFESSLSGHRLCRTSSDRISAAVPGSDPNPFAFKISMNFGTEPFKEPSSYVSAP